MMTLIPGFQRFVCKRKDYLSRYLISEIISIFNLNNSLFLEFKQVEIKA